MQIMTSFQGILWILRVYIYIHGTNALVRPSGDIPWRQESVIVTDLIAQSFIKIFNNAFLNTIERVRPVASWAAGRHQVLMLGAFFVLVHASTTPDIMGDVPMSVPCFRMF
jgi:hypothetical protein